MKIVPKKNASNMLYWIILVLLMLWVQMASAESIGSTATSIPSSPLKTIIVDHYEPYTFLNKNGAPDGFSVDLMKAVAQVMGMEVQISAGLWEHAMDALKTGKIDFLPMTAASKERRIFFDFSAPHTIAYDAFFTRKNDSPIRSQDDLSGKAVIVMKDDQAHDYLCSTDIVRSENLIFIDNIPDALRRLASGQGDAALMPKLVGLIHIKRLNLANLELSPVVVEAYNRPFSFAVKKGNLPLLERLSQGLSIVKKTGQYDQIYEKWFGPLEVQNLSTKALFKALMVPILVLLLMGSIMLLWLFTLKKQVAFRTRSLENEIIERRRTEEELRLNESRLEALDKLNRMTEASVHQLTDFALEEAIRLTKSDIGYLAFMNEDETVLEMYSWSQNAMEQCRINDQPKSFPIETTGLWGEAVRQRKPVITNEYAAENPFKKGCPEGHVKIARHMNIPVFDAERIVAVAGVGNKQEAYDSSDVRQLTLLMDGMWKIIQRKQAEEKLLFTNILLETQQNTSTDGMLVVDDQGGLISFNQKFVDMWEIPTDIAKSKSDEFVLNSVLHKVADPKAFLARIKHLYAHPQEISTDEIALTGGITLERYSTPMHDRHGKYHGRFWHFRDISGHKRVEEALRKERDRAQSYLDVAGVMIVAINADGKVMVINRKGCEILGYAPDEIIGKEWFDHFLPARIKNESKIAFQQLLEGKIHLVAHFEKPVLTRNGVERWISWNNTVLQDEAGNIVGTLGSGEDITERRQAEEALRESREQYRAVVEDMPAMICRFLPDGALTFVNKAFCDQFEKTQEELTGQNVFQLMPKAQQETVRNHFMSLSKETPMATHERQEALPGATVRWQQWVDRALFDAHGQLAEYQAVGWDVTESKLAQEAATRTEKRLQQAQKMEAIGTLAAGIAHDFNNILGAILFSTDLALSEISQNNPFRWNFEHVLSATERAKDLVRQILSFCRQDTQARKPINIIPVIKEVLKLLKASLPSTIEIRQNISTSIGTVFGDPTEIHQILMNLCANAAHSMQETGGTLTVSLEDLVLDLEASKQYPDLSPGPFLKLTVQDTGHGMDNAVLERIFEPYFTTKKMGEGSGLGLAVVHGIVKQYCGAITAQSKAGEGSAFQILLPRLHVKAFEEMNLNEPIPTGTERILFVDDETDLVEIGSKMFTRLGYDVLATSSSTEALAFFQTAPDSFDLVVTDQTMPNMTGSELAKNILEIRPEIPVVICTGYSAVLSEDQAKSIGIRAFIMKPFSLREIGKVIRNVLDAKTD